MLVQDIDITLMKPREVRDQLGALNQKLREARLDATCNGSIRYDKDRVISSASDDGLVNKVDRIFETEKQIERKEQELHEAIHNANDLISCIDKDLTQKVVRAYYCEMLSCRQIGLDLLISPRHARRLKDIGKLEIIEKNEKKG